MKKNNYLLVIRTLVCFLIFNSVSFAAGLVSLNLSFVNSQTGVGVVPGYIQLYNTETKENIIFTSGQLKESIKNKSIPTGKYFLSAGSNGFAPVNTNIEISGNELNLILNLDPVFPDPNLSDQRIKIFHVSGYQFYAGFTIDAVSLQPLPNVEISTPDNKKFVSDVNGYFEFSYPAECGGNKYSDLKFSKTGYKTLTDQNIENFPDNDIILKIEMERGSGEVFSDGKNFRRRIDEINFIGSDCSECIKSANKIDDQLDAKLTGTLPIPANIKVGRSCTGTNCSTVEVYSIDTYCKYVIPAEVYGCWGSLTGGMNSLQAFATAVRTYAIYYIYHPISSTYDICDNTYCQMLGSSQNSYANTAVDNTSRYVMLNSSGNIVRSEYAAENNDLGCGDGFSGTGSAWPCISDLVCSGIASNGHGRGLCQWGTIRWATGTKVLVSSPCSLGVTHGYGTKTWQGILDHYYNVPGYNWTLNQAGTASIVSNSSVPNSIPACGTVSLQYNINSTSNLTLFLAASIAPTGTSNYISDPAHDVKLAINSGTSNYIRQFAIRCNTVPGSYDLLTALWYDKNNNNVIDAGDLVIDSKLTSHALIVGPSSGINLISSEIPDKYLLYLNHPNPFNPSTKIKFDLAGSSFVNINIFDVSGKLIENITSSEMNAGKYEIAWNAVFWPSGMYYCRMEAGGFTGTIKLMLIK